MVFISMENCNPKISCSRKHRYISYWNPTPITPYYSRHDIYFQLKTTTQKFAVLDMIFILLNFVYLVTEENTLISKYELSSIVIILGQSHFIVQWIDKEQFLKERERVQFLACFKTIQLTVSNLKHSDNGLKLVTVFGPRQNLTEVSYQVGGCH